MTIAHEQDLVAACLYKPELAPRTGIGDEDFQDQRLARCFNAILALQKAGEPVTPVSVSEFDPEAGSVCRQLVESPSPVRTVTDNLDGYVRRIRNAKANTKVTELVGKVCSEHDGIGSLAEKLIGSLIPFTKTDGGDTWKTADEWIREEIDMLGMELPGLFTNLPIDQFGPLNFGAITVLAAQTSMGKSSLARTIAASVAKSGSGVHYFSLEDSGRAFARRQISDESDTPLSMLTQLGQLSMQQHETLARCRKAGRGSWVVDAAAGLTAREISARILRHKHQINTKLVVIDYIQELKRPKGASRYEALGDAVHELSTLARKENIALLLLSQLNRESMKRDPGEGRPRISDLKDSSEIEQSADRVIFIHRPGYYEAHKDQSLAEIIVAKNKNGPRGICEMEWKAPTASFE